MWYALTRPVSPSLARCELTHLSRQPIDVSKAALQHTAYEVVLETLGVTVLQLAPEDDMPDAVFVEDTAVVLDEVAVITRPGAASRRQEPIAVAEVLEDHRPLARMMPPATLDGGDVLRLGRTLHVGLSNRTNSPGLEQLGALVAPYGYDVQGVEFEGCLHLKSAVTALTDDLLLANPDWVSLRQFPGCDAIPVDEREPHAANALRVEDAIVYPGHHRRTLERLLARDLRVETTDISELAKAEGGVTCCSLLFRAGDAARGRPR